MEEATREPGMWLVCRTCMNESEDRCALFDEDAGSARVADMVAVCTGLQVDKSDGLPEYICAMCFDTVNNFIHFRSAAEHSENTLRKMLVERQVKLENSVPVKIEPDVDIEIDFIPQASDSDSESDKPLIKLEKLDAPKKHCCSVCGKLFQKLSRLQRHEKIHTKIPKVKLATECEICFKKFKKPNQLLRHRVIHDSTSRPFECTRCSQRFRVQGRLLAHMISHQCSAPQLEDVKMKLEISGSEITPVENSQVSSPHTCVQCDVTFQSNHSLCAHMRKHRRTDRVLACCVCGKVFKKTSHLKRHERSHEDYRSFKCGLCSKSFATEVMLYEHTNKHKGVKPHVCPVCGKAFSQRGTLTAHVRVHTRERPHLCPTCGKRFDSSTNLKQHMRRHAGDKAFACTYCPGKYVSKGELNSHMSTHTGARPFVCDSCGSAFTKPNSLAKHKLRHLGIKPHECDVCLMKFTSKEHLKRHYRIHTGEKPYKCNMCERAFTQSNDLVKHKRAHLGDNLYRCKECSQSFRLKTELRDHISGHFISSQVAAGVPIALPPEMLYKSVPEKPVARVPAPVEPSVVVTGADKDTVLAVDKASRILAQKLLSSDSAEKLLADHVKNIPTAITVKRITSMT